MNTAERRAKILDLIAFSSVPISGTTLSKECGVSRQIIVSDIAALKSENEIIATSKGYILNKPKPYERILKLVHTDEEIEDELMAVVKCGGRIKDVFIWHKIYGKIEAAMNIVTEMDIAEYMQSLKSGRSKPLKQVTYDYHYHTIEADEQSVLDKVEKVLDERGYLVKED